jgi:hypothetical protein
VYFYSVSGACQQKRTGGIPFAGKLAMSRVEPKEQPEPAPREANKGRRQPSIGHTPGKAEGEERDVSEALEKQEQKS